MQIGGIKRPKTETKAEREARIKREIYNRKRRWSRADEAGKRVLVAKDILLQIAARKFDPQTSKFLLIESNQLEKMEGSDSLQGCLLDNNTGCRGCAIGGAMMSMIRFNNTAIFNDTNYNNENERHLAYHKGTRVAKSADNALLSQQLKDLFGEEQLRLIEQAFERCSGVYRLKAISRYNQFSYDKLIEMDLKNDSPQWKAYMFGRAHYEDKDRLVAIMENIIKNKGTFIP